MIIENLNGKYSVKTDSYQIVMSEDVIDVVIAGEVLAGLPAPRTG